MIRINRTAAVVLSGLIFFISGAGGGKKLSLEQDEKPATSRAQRVAASIKDAQSKFAAAVALRNDDIAARRAFRVAAAAYYQLEQVQGETPGIRCMQGNTCVLAGNAPFAIFYYRCGLAAEQDNPDLMRGLEYARSRVAYASEDEWRSLKPKLGMFQRIKNHVHRWGTLLVAFIGIMGWLTLSRWIVTRKPWLLAIAIPALVTTGLLVTIWLIDHSDRMTNLETQPRYAVLEKSEVLRSGDGQNFSPVRESPLPAGVEVRVVRFGDDWWQIQLADGTLGWMPKLFLALITEGYPLFVKQ